MRKLIRRLYFGPSVEEERDFEKQHVSELKKQYLLSDPLDRMEHDPGYKDKIELIKRYVSADNGWILDIGSNTCGEMDCLSAQGYCVICTDINEVALDIAKQRASKFGRPNRMEFAACNGHALPFSDGSVHTITFIEALHHMSDVPLALEECFRVLAPGGAVMFYEPYAYNPYRRLSEIRDRYQGHLEKSFSKRQLNRNFAGAGFDKVIIDRHVPIPSSWKKDMVSPYRRMLKDVYFKVSKSYPAIFAALVGVAIKPGTLSAKKQPFAEILRCPISKTKLREAGGILVSEEGYKYLILNGIPVLIDTDAERIERG